VSRALEKQGLQGPLNLSKRMREQARDHNRGLFEQPELQRLARRLAIYLGGERGGMDVLHFLKAQHEGIKSAFERVGSGGVKSKRAGFEALARDLSIYVTLEKDYLFPELTGLGAGLDALVSVGQANGATIDRRLKTLAKEIVKPADEQDKLAARLTELQELVVRHFEQEERSLMPKIRDLIRTEEREDLGQVFVEARDDLLAAAAAPAAGAVKDVVKAAPVAKTAAKPPLPSRRRA
jgi:hypothetical protein